MIQRRSSFGFALKTADCLGTLDYVVGQELESYKATELLIFGLVYDTHRAGAEFLEDVIVRDGLPNHWRECYFCETGKSMKGQRLPISQENCWRKIASLTMSALSTIL
jgi:hypothetical protein